MSLLSSNNFRGLSRGNGTISVGNKTTGMSPGGVPVVSMVHWYSTSKCGMSEVGSLGSEDLRGLSGGDSTTWVGNKLDSRGGSHASE